MAMDPDVGDAACRPHKLCAQFERLRDSDGFNGDVGPHPVRQGLHCLDRVVGGVVDGDVRTEGGPGTFGTRVSDVDGDDFAEDPEHPVVVDIGIAL
jgi:hypothetical protein